jgi:hypothetical protein
VKAWWDRALAFDGMAPLVNVFDGYVEWGSGSWQYDATTTVDFDWVGYGHPCNLPQLLNINRQSNRIVVSWPTNALGFVLQTAANLAPANWAAATNATAVVNDQYFVTNNLPATPAFFRLAR